MRIGLRGSVCGIVLGSVLASALSGCSDLTYGDSRRTDEPGFMIEAASSVLELTSGTTVSTTIRSVRAGRFTSAITFSVESAPAGLVLKLERTMSSDSTALSVSADSTLPPGSYDIVVHADADGAPQRELRLVVTVRRTVSVTPTLAYIAGGLSNCALTTDRRAYCWGDNTGGALGHGDTISETPFPRLVSGDIRFQSLSISKDGESSCGLRVDGVAYCWGANKNGQLGDATQVARLTPTPIASDLSFRSIAVGRSHVCAVSTTGDGYCWGFTAQGALGNAMLGTQVIPRRAAVGLELASVVAGGDYTCALTTLGAAYCWGSGLVGQLGDGRAVSSTTPVAVSGGLRFRTLAAGESTVCGLTEAGAAYCWAFNFYGTTGDGVSGLEGGVSRHLSPVAVVGGHTFVSLSAGYQTVCGITGDFSAYCWGNNDSGNVGDGTTTHRALPVRVQGAVRFEQIAAGAVSTCGLTTAHTVYCWGENYNGALGIGRAESVLIATPTAVVWPIATLTR